MTGDDRAVSDVMGFILVFGLVATTVAIISLGGFSTLEDVRDREQANNAERAFDVLADNMADIHREGAPSRATEISLRGAQLRTTDTVSINVTWEEAVSRDRVELVDTEVTPIIWSGSQGEETELVYALGAVIRSERNGGVVLEEPPFVLQRERMVVPVVKTVTDDPSSYGESTVRVRGIETNSLDMMNETTVADYEHLWFNVTTPRADIWRQYFEQRDLTEACLREETGEGPKVACKLEPTANPYMSLHGIEVVVEG